MKPLRLGISACLLGHNVRFDGGHKRDSFLVDQLGSWVEWVPVCPEAEAGLGIPRETLRLEDDRGTIRVIAPGSGLDRTSRLKETALEQIARLPDDLCGYVLKKDSPSCGMARVRVYRDGNLLHKSGTGIFAATLEERLPHLAVEEEGRLQDPRIRENFVAAIFARRRWLDLNVRDARFAALMTFHERHKFLLMSRSPSQARELGRSLARMAESRDRGAVEAKYWPAFHHAFRVPPTRRRHANALQHIAGFVSEYLDGGERKELVDLIDDYRLERVPLVAPITLLRHFIRKHDVPYVRDQYYLHPHPARLGLLNAV